MLIGQQHRSTPRSRLGCCSSRFDFFDACIAEDAHDLRQEGISLAGRGRWRVCGHVFLWQLRFFSRRQKKVKTAIRISFFLLPLQSFPSLVPLISFLYYLVRSPASVRTCGVAATLEEKNKGPTERKDGLEAAMAAATTTPSSRPSAATTSVVQLGAEADTPLPIDRSSPPSLLAIGRLVGRRLRVRDRDREREREREGEGEGEIENLEV